VEKTSATGVAVGLRCSVGRGGTGGVKAFMSDDADEGLSEASVLDRSLTVLWPIIFPQNALVFARTDDFGLIVPFSLGCFGLVRTHSGLFSPFILSAGKAEGEATSVADE